VKLIADAYFPEGVVQSLNEAGYDALHALEIGAGDLPLREFLRLAAFESRVVVTRNRSVARLVESDAGMTWPSVIFFRQDAVEEQAMTSTLFNLLKLFDEDLKDGALVIVRDGQTLLRKFIRP
jgi:predicted nuclease of predicted toxin-antitoxin system